MSKLPTLPRKKDGESIGTEPQSSVQIFSFPMETFSLQLLILVDAIVFNTNKPSGFSLCYLNRLTSTILFPTAHHHETGQNQGFREVTGS